MLLIDTFPGALDEARALNIAVLQAEVLSEHGEEKLSGYPVDYLLAATPDEIYNGLVCTRLMPELGRQRVFQLAPPGGRLDQRRGLDRDWRGRALGNPPLDFTTLEQRFEAGLRFVIAPTGSAESGLIVLYASGALHLATTEEGEVIGDDGKVVYQAVPRTIRAAELPMTEPAPALLA